MLLFASKVRVCFNKKMKFLCRFAVLLTTVVTVCGQFGPPIITSQPANMTVNVGDSLALSIGVSGSPTALLQWFKDDRALAGATGTTVLFSSASASDSGGYFVVAKNTINGIEYSATSSTAKVSVLIVAPKIVTQPSVVAEVVLVQIGSSRVFSVAVTGTPPFSYQWYKTVPPIVGATTSSLTLSPKLGDNLTTTTYWVRVSNAAGSVESNHFWVEVVDAPAIFTQPSESRTVIEGTALALEVGASGRPEPTFQWTNNGRNIEGATSASFTVAVANASNSGSYAVAVSNKAGRVISRSAAVKVLPLPTVLWQPQSQVQSVEPGANLSLSVATSGPEPMTHQWFFRGEPIIGAVSSNLNIKNVQLMQAGPYRVLATYEGVPVVREVSASQFHSMVVASDGSMWGTGYNNMGQLCNSLTENRLAWAPSIASGVVSVSTGQLHTMFIRSDGTLWGAGDNSVGQLGNGNTVSSGTPIRVASDVKSVSCGFNHTMFIKQDGSLWAMGSNAFGQLGDGGGRDRSAPVLVDSDISVVAAGNAHTMYVKRDGSLWGVGDNFWGQLGDGTFISRGKPVKIAEGVEGVFVNKNLLPQSSGPAFGRGYTLFTKRGATLWGMGDRGLLKPEHEVQYINKPIFIADNVKTASAGLSYSAILKKDGSLIVNGSIIPGVAEASTVSCGGDNVLMVAAGVLLGRGGNRVVLLGNSTYTPPLGGTLGDGSIVSRSNTIKLLGGAQSSSVVLSVRVTPVIVSQPRAKSVDQGYYGSLEVIADGYPLPEYQWRKGAVDIPGATRSVLEFPSASALDSGLFSVTVRNAFGSVSSDAAKLDVLPPSPAVIGANLEDVYTAVGQSVSLRVEVSGSPSPGIQWYKNGSPIAGETRTVFTIASVSTNDAGSYSVKVTNVLGGSTYTAISNNIAFNVLASRLINLSILTHLDHGEIMTLGTVLGGSGTSGSKSLVVRGAGPSLAQLGVSGFMGDPRLDLFRGQTLVASNDNWGGASELASSFKAVGAFAYSSLSSLDAAISGRDLYAGNYTIQVRGTGVSEGTVIAELYDATPASSFSASTPRLINISVLKDIRPGNMLTLGFVIGGVGSKRVLIRAVGPSLGLPPFNIVGVMADPRLSLFSGQQVTASNDNWGSQSLGLSAAQISAAADAVGAFRISDTGSRDAVLLVSLSPGNYTAQVASVGVGGGFVITEVYELP